MALTPDQIAQFQAMGWMPPGMTAQHPAPMGPLPAPQASPDMQGPGAAGAAANVQANAAGLSPDAAAGQAAGQAANASAAAAGPAPTPGMSKAEALGVIRGFAGAMKPTSSAPIAPPVTPPPQLMQIAPIGTGSGGGPPPWQ